MKRVLTIFLVVAASALVGADANRAAPEASVYQVMGGVAQLSMLGEAFSIALVKDESVLANAKLQGAFSGLHPAALKFQITSALCQLAGGPERYTGVAVPQLVRELGITETEWLAGVGVLGRVLSEQKVDEGARKELLARAEGVWKSIADVEARTYRSKERKFSVLLPAGWEKQENAGGLALICASPKKDEKDAFRENLNVAMEELPLDMTAAEYTKATVLAASKQLKDFKVVESLRADVGGEAAEVLVYTHKSGPVPMVVASYFMVKGRRAVVVNCAAAEDQFQAYRAVFAESVRTFRLD